MLEFLSCCIMMSLILSTLFNLTNYTSASEEEKKSAFECGFEPLSEMRSPFSIRFFMLVILFLIFDIEASLLFPIISILTFNKTTLIMTSFFLFLLILLIGLFHEWKEGAIDWVTVF